MIYYIVKWMKKLLLTVPSFSSTSLFYYILSHFKIIRCIVETLIAFSTYFLLTSTSLPSHLFLLGCLKLNLGLLLDHLRLAWGDERRWQLWSVLMLILFWLSQTWQVFLRTHELCFLVALCCLIVRWLNLEVANKRRLHQQIKIPG